MGKPVHKLLFVCTGNTCRSPMAEALFRHLWQKAASGEPDEPIPAVASAGTQAPDGGGATAEAVEVLREKGIDLSVHRSRRVTAELVDEADLVLTMTRRHREAVLRLAPHAAAKVHALVDFLLGDRAGDGDGIPDPFGLDIEVYRSTAASLEGYIAQLVHKLRQPAPE